MMGRRRSKKTCLHPAYYIAWHDRLGMVCVSHRSMADAHTKRCTVCGEILPFGEAIVPYAEAMAFAFLEGAFDHVQGGFPSVAFHDGYRNYNERVENWVDMSPRLDGTQASGRIASILDDYAAGAFAFELEADGWPWP